MNESEITMNEVGQWMTKDFQMQLEQIQKEIELKFWYYMNEHSIAKNKARRSNRKFAIIQVGNTRQLCFMDNEDTSIAYKMEDYGCTEMRWRKFIFIRWATSFDL